MRGRRSQRRAASPATIAATSSTPTHSSWPNGSGQRGRKNRLSKLTNAGLIVWAASKDAHGHAPSLTARSKSTAPGKPSRRRRLASSRMARWPATNDAPRREGRASLVNVRFGAHLGHRHHDDARIRDVVSGTIGLRLVAQSLAGVDCVIPVDDRAPYARAAPDHAVVHDDRVFDHHVLLEQHLPADDRVANLAPADQAA